MLITDAAVFYAADEVGRALRRPARPHDSGLPLLHAELQRRRHSATCLEVNWLNAHGYDASFGCHPRVKFSPRHVKWAAALVPFALTKRIDPLVSFRLWRFCRKHRIDLVKSFSSKDHWPPCLFIGPAFPSARSRCIADPIEGANRTFVYRYGCSRIIADAPVIKRQLVADNRIAPEKIEVIGSAVDLSRFHPNRRTKFRSEFGIPANAPLIVNVGMIRPDKGQLTLVEAARLVLQQRPDARFVFIGEGTGSRKLGIRLHEAIERSGSSMVF